MFSMFAIFRRLATIHQQQVQHHRTFLFKKNQDSSIVSFRIIKNKAISKRVKISKQTSLHYFTSAWYVTSHFSKLHDQITSIHITFFTNTWMIASIYKYLLLLLFHLMVGKHGGSSSGVLNKQIVTPLLFGIFSR